MTIHAIVAAALAIVAAPLVATAQSPAPASSASSAPTVAPYSGTNDGQRARRVHRAIVTCDYAPFYSWPTPSAAPAPASYPPARAADAFEVIGDGTLTYNALTLYETTIDVVQPYGAGKHYWISARCINAG